MQFVIKWFFHTPVLTLLHDCVIYIKFALKINIPVVPKRGVLPTARKKGIITLTLVISRTSILAPVTRGLYVMKWNLFRIKTKLEIQIEEYLEWKGKFSIYAADIHREVLTNFNLKHKKYKDISEVTLVDIQDFYNQLPQASYGRIKSMEAVRGLMRYFGQQKQHSIKAREITNTGVTPLKSVVKNDIIPRMIKRGPGRPPNIPFIKRVKLSRDTVGLSFRAIARAEKSSPGNVHRAYSYDLSKFPSSK